MNNTVQTLKYAGLAGGAVALVFSIYVVYSIWDWLYDGREYYRGRFLLTATVEVDGELKSGSSVYEVSYNAKRRGSGFGASPINGARGTMPVIDLGKKHGILALSFYGGTPYYPAGWVRRGDCDLTTPDSLPIRLIRKKYPGISDFRGVVKKLINHESPLETNIYMPLVAVIGNPKFEKIIMTNFCHVDSVVDHRIKAVRIRIEKTEMPIETEDPYPDISGHYAVWRSNF